MKFFAIISALFVLAFASFVAAHLDERAYVTVTTIETITSCKPEVTECHVTKTSVYTPPVITSVPIYSNTSSFTTTYPNATNSTTAPISTFTGAANAISGPTYAVAAAIAGIFAFIM